MSEKEKALLTYFKAKENLRHAWSNFNNAYDDYVEAAIENLKVAEDELESAKVNLSMVCKAAS